MVEHANVSSNNIHEPKGAAAASVDTVYISDGAGSGDWELIPPASITGVTNLNYETLTYTIADVGTAASYWVVIPWAGDIYKIYTVIDGAIATADESISFEIAGTAITNGTVTITQSGSAAGDVDTATPTAAKTVTAGQALEIISAGNSTGSVACTITIIVDVS